MRNAVLFWDEPEANLNPRLITKVAAVLRLLASRGVQVFVSTHDYLLSHEIAMAVDYHTKPRVLTRFYAFGRPKPADPVEVQAAEQLSDLEDNAILQEFAAHYDREQRLFLSAPARGGP